ncbi:50S ribosomal protein L25 [Candidatus Acetothermia bacterium]|nr:50S ribosomal protein L25 [Candidatus Acetothermia bacterium]MBI3643261.1 50S ribosomal protein L25 [Candidatus Acetothermia bacterium]
MAYTLTAAVREVKNPKELRRSGLVPGVVYGREFHKEITIPQHDLEKLLSKITRSSRISLKLDGQVFPTFIKEIHYHPLSDRVLHIDLFRPAEGKPIKIQVPVKFVGEPVGKKKGGATNRLRDAIQVAGASDSIPELLEVDISHLDVGDSVRAGEVKVPSAIQLLTPKEILLVQVMIPRKIEEAVAAPAEGEAAAEGAAATGEPGAAPAAEGAKGAAPKEAGKGGPSKEGAKGGKEAPKEEKKGK